MTDCQDLLSKLEVYKFRNEINLESADESWGDFKQEEIRRSVYRIGNLTLLERKLNLEADPYIIPKKPAAIIRVIALLSVIYPKTILPEAKINFRSANAIWRIQELNF
jgi:hypothetical protein